MDETPGQPPEVPPPPGEPSAVEGTLPPRGIGQILGEAFRVYRENAGRLWILVAIVVVPLSFLSWLISTVFLGPVTSVTTVGGQTVEVVEPRSLLVGILASLVAAAISIVIGAILQAATLRAGALATIGDPVDVAESYRWGLRRFGSVLLVSILVGIVVAFGFILLVVPGVIFLTFLAVSVPAVVVEGARGTGAMRRSWRLVRGHFWHVLGVVVVGLVIAGVVAGLISALGRGNDVLGLVFGTIGQIVVAPFTALVTVLLYLDLRARSETLTLSGVRAEVGAA